MEADKMIFTMPAIFSDTLRKHGKSGAYAFVGEEPLTWEIVSARIGSLAVLLKNAGVVAGDRVAILSTNQPNWAIAYFAISFSGAVVVPILPDFSPTEVNNVLEHSGSKLIFVSSGLLNRVEGDNPSTLETVLLTDDFTVVSSTRNILPYNPEDTFVFANEVREEDIASIIYTSGTTGRSKGVMLTHKNIVFNATRGKIIQPLDETDRFLSVLPLSHTYENTLGLILPLLCGSCVYYLRKPPTPPVLLPALEAVRPTIMLTVPLIIEKIYFNKILPAFNDKMLLRSLYKVPFLRKKLNEAAGKKLKATFGGQLKFYGVGGAKLNKSVEKFLIEAKFPYAIGYGLTETAPLLAGANPSKTVYESTGPKIDGIELIINNPDKVTGEGEIWARGATVMKGYYNEPEMTAEVLTPDGWFKTGDLGSLDSEGNLFIKGRLKNMIVGASGENIYPEEIESVINNFRHVVESLVVEQKGKLVALVHFNMEELEKKYNNLRSDMNDKVEVIAEEVTRELKEYVNSQVSKFHQINKVVLQPGPFQKTATLKIKRFLYT